jgi:hypothetical protein
MKTQAWGWLAAGVLAAGLNASYHDGGMQWAHEIANRIEHRTNAVMALATGNADRFLAEARLVTNQEQASPCPLSMAVARAQARISRSDVQFARLQAASDRRLAQIERDRARIEAEFARVRIPAVAFRTVNVSVPRVIDCPRVHVNIPQPPQTRIPAMPNVHVSVPHVQVPHIDIAGAGPV